MDPLNFLTASPSEQMRMLLKSIEEKAERLDPQNFLLASPIDKITMLINSKESQKEKVKSGYYLTAPLHEQIHLLACQVQEQIKKEQPIKADELKFHLEWLERSKKHIIDKLNAIPKTHPDVGNLQEVNELLDKLCFIMNELLKKTKPFNN